MNWPVNPLRGKTTDWRAVCGKSACTVRRGEGPNSIGPSYPYQCVSFLRGNGVINEAGCWDYSVGMTLGAIHVSQVPQSGWPRPLPPPIGCNLSTNRKRKPKWRRCVAASVAFGPSAILTGSRTRPSDWGWKGRFGPVEDRRNNHRLVTVACIIWILQIWWLAVTLLAPDLVAVTLLAHNITVPDAFFCLRTFEPGRRPDPRAPLVYLRSFGDDDRVISLRGISSSRRSRHCHQRHSSRLLRHDEPKMLPL